jgi:hypothetical protein
MHRKGEPLDDETLLLAERIMVTDLTWLRLDLLQGGSFLVTSY